MALVDYGAGNLEPECLQLYLQTEKHLQALLNTRNRVVIQTGEGMLALWSALKSTLQSGDRVLVISTGIFGYGFKPMAEAIGCEVRTVEYGYDETIHGLERIETAIREFQPKMITVVHCETPSGTLNPLKELGALKVKYGVPLLCADVVASVGGAFIETDAWQIDLAMGGSQKCLSAPANMSFLSVSEAAWKAAREVGYDGYDSLLCFSGLLDHGVFPYTPDWQGLAQLHKACELIAEEGVEKCLVRHVSVAEYTRMRLTEMGLKLYPVPEAVCSPTVTAVYVPESIGWETLDRALRAQGVVVGGNHERLAGKVFRIGHMGSQASLNRVKEGLDILEEILRKAGQ